jgi:hypothetical protein
MNLVFHGPKIIPQPASRDQGRPAADTKLGGSRKQSGSARRFVIVSRIVLGESPPVVKAAFAALVSAAVFVGAATAGFAQVAPTPNPNPPTPPPPPNANATAPDLSTPAPVGSPVPSPTATPGGRGRGRNNANKTPAPAATAVDTPEPPQFSSLDGVWDFVLQPSSGKLQGKYFYSHIAFAQSGDKLVGQWNRDNPAPKAVYPFTGSFDGRIFKLTLTPQGGGTPLTMAGYVENFGDMVGLLDDGAGNTTPFTAAHRKKVKFYEQPGIGVPGAGGQGVPGGTGRPPGSP